ncbi:DinB family protein [Edaphobacter sp. 12200R-103]|uniref:DinB family protein n=1 Tax=Edaphobacter sp. 12200R-103 TaxID=2703788 RepID=UPI001EE3BE0D|nr:DinB family protein [Edaphobacter sp. 12200R-103]
MCKRIMMIGTLAFGCAVGAWAQQPGAMTPKTESVATVEPSKSFDAALSALEAQFMGLAKAMPADKYSFAPSAAIFAPSQKTDYLSPDNKGVRNFGQMVAHVAQANYFYGGMLSGLKPDVNVKAIGSLTDKDQIIAALEKSFAFTHQAIGTLTAENAFQGVRGDQTRASLAAGVIAHGFDHYGQLAEYLRMNGIIPPASAKK